MRTELSGSAARRLLMLVVACVSLVGSGCESRTDAAEDRSRVPDPQVGGRHASFDVSLVAFLPAAGTVPVDGEAMLQATRAAVRKAREAIADTGLGKDIGVRLLKRQSTGVRARTDRAAAKLAPKRPGCLAGPWTAADMNSLADSFSGSVEVPLVSPAVPATRSSTPDGGGWLNRLVQPLSTQSSVLASVVGDAVGIEKPIVVVGSTDAFGREFVREFEAAWKRRGGAPAKTVLFDPDGSLRSTALSILTEKPAAVVVGSYPKDFTPLARALREAPTAGTAKLPRFAGRRLFLHGFNGVSTTPREVPRAVLEDAVGVGPGVPASSSSLAFAQMFPGPSRTASAGFAAQAFDAAVLCFLAAVASGSDEGSAIASQIRSVSGPPGIKYDFEELAGAVRALRAGVDIDYEGVSGPIDLDRSGNPRKATYDVFSYVGGRLIVERKLTAKSTLT